jgi:hypothetical protein
MTKKDGQVSVQCDVHKKTKKMDAHAVITMVITLPTKKAESFMIKHQDEIAEKVLLMFLSVSEGIEQQQAPSPNQAGVY